MHSAPTTRSEYDATGVPVLLVAQIVCEVDEVHSNQKRVCSRRGHPPGFDRAGGSKLPLKERREAIAEIAEKTQGADLVETVRISSRVVRQKWDMLAKQPGDITNFSFGPPSVTPYRGDPAAHRELLSLLARLPDIPSFAAVLDAEEATVWKMSFGDGKTQMEIGSVIDKSQGEVSKTLAGAVEKVNAQYHELKKEDALPIEIEVWVQQIEPSRVNPDLAAALAALRERDRAFQKGEVITTGCEELDDLAIRSA